MRSVCRLALALGLLATPNLLFGQASGEELRLGAPLSFQEARREALARDPTLAQLSAEVEGAKQRALQPRFLDAPMLEGQIWQWPVSTLNPSQVDMYMLSVSQEFPGRGKRGLREAVLQTDVALLQSHVEARQRDVEAEVRAAYVDLETTRQVIAIQVATLPLLRQAVAASQARYELGTSSQSDLLAGVIAVARLRGDLIELEESSLLSLARLNTLMLREPDTPIGSLEDLGEPAPLLPVADLERMALERHPDLAEARTLTARARAMENEARGDLRADIRISSGFMLRPREGDAWMASVGLTWPTAPWARRKIDARVAEARAESDAAAAAAAVASAATKLRVRESYIKAVAAERRATLLRSTILPQSRQAIAMASAAYQAETAEFQAVLAEQRTLLESQIAYVRATSEAAQAIAELERIVGSDVTVAADAAGK